MKRRQAFKFRLRSDGQQEREMRRFTGACRFVFNRALARQNENHEAGNRYISYTKMTSWLVESYSNGVGVGLGNGWASEVKIGDSGLSDASFTNKSILVSGSTSVPITSTLRVNGNTSSGDISGNIVISITMDSIHLSHDIKRYLECVKI